MIKRVTKLSQVLDALDNDRATFYHGKSKDKDNLDRETIKQLSPQEVNKLIEEGLIIKISRT